VQARARVRRFARVERRFTDLRAERRGAQRSRPRRSRVDPSVSALRIGAHRPRVARRRAMKRRTFATGAALAGVTLGWPSWLSRAFGDEKACDPKARPPSVAAVAGAFRRAERAGKPLLVLVIPSDDVTSPIGPTDEKFDRGQAFGELLNFGSDADLAPLAGV